VALDILGIGPAALRGDANVTTLAAAGPYVTNSFEAPNEARSCLDNSSAETAPALA
jgi:hypothetical protein